MTGDDHARLGDDAESLVTWLGNTAFMRLDLGSKSQASHGLRRCGALAIDPLLGTFACSIYARRPQVCRDLERGADACRGELAAKADRPPQALLLLRSLISPRRTSQ